MNYTSKEQSKRLIELGLSKDTADMFYPDTNELTEIRTLPRCIEFVDDTAELPCWSVGALMNLLPPSIQTGEGMQNQYEIDIRKYWGNEENLYQIAYGNDRGLSEEWHDMINTGEKESLCDAVFEMVCWLLKNGYIKKEE